MYEKILELLEKINNNLEIIKNKKSLPRIIYAKEIAQNYKINVNKATDFCKKYGTNFGGYCIELNKFRRILQTKGLDIFK